MSLYIGNLSARTCRDELEHVLRRFGCCKVGLKREGYGFVEYDIHPNAEKALRALQGQNICGEPLSLTWSNKQPRPFQRFARGARTYDLQRERNSDEIGYARRKLSSNGWRNHKMGHDRRTKSVDMHSGDTLPMKQQSNERRLSDSHLYRKPLKNEFSPVAKETEGHWRKDYGRIKRIRKEIEAPKKPSTRKTRRSISSSLHSDRLASRSRSISSSSKSMPRSSSRSRSRSRAVSSRARSLLSNLRSSSKSHYSRARSSNSRRSRPPTSLSASLNQSLASSLDKVQLDSKGLSINAIAPKALDNLTAQGQQIVSNFDLENDNLKIQALLPMGMLHCTPKWWTTWNMINMHRTTTMKTIFSSIHQMKLLI